MSLLICAETVSYYRHYVMDIDHDNIYITEEVRQIDRDREKLKKPSVLPLKHFERDFYVDPMRKKLRRQEWFSIAYSLLYMILIILGISGLFLIDWVCYTGLDVVRQNALVNFTQTGFFNFTVSVNGSGLLARIIRNVTSGLNFTEFLSLNETNANCLPRPTFTSWQSYLKVYALAAAILYMTVNLTYSKRMMSVVCGNYFPKKHQMRVKYLYNQMLIRRRIYFEESLLNLVGEKHVQRGHDANEMTRTDRGRRGKPQPKLTTLGAVKQKFQTLLKRFGTAYRRMLEKCFGRVNSTVYCTACLERREYTACLLTYPSEFR